MASLCSIHLTSLYALTDMYADYFVGKREVTLTFWNSSWALGFGLQYAWSSLFCVREKLYIMMGLLVLSVVCAGVKIWWKPCSRIASS